MKTIAQIENTTRRVFAVVEMAEPIPAPPAEVLFREEQDFSMIGMYWNGATYQKDPLPAPAPQENHTEEEI